MDIKRKSDGAIVRDVWQLNVDSQYKWRKEEQDHIIYYHKTHWEPVEEWVDIQVSKRDWVQAMARDPKHMVVGGYGVLYRETPE